MIIRYLTAALVMVLVMDHPVTGQDEPEQVGFRDRIFFGGNFGLQFGTITNIELSPLAGYYLTPKLSAGVGIRYEFFKESRNSYLYQGYETNIYGASVFTRYMLFNNLGERLNLEITNSIFAHAEYEMLSLEKKYFEIPQTLEEGRFLVHSILVGGGIYQPLGRKSGFIMMILWNLNESASSPYNSPVIRIGFTF